MKHSEKELLYKRKKVIDDLINFYKVLCPAYAKAIEWYIEPFIRFEFEYSSIPYNRPNYFSSLRTKTNNLILDLLTHYPQIMFYPEKYGITFNSETECEYLFGDEEENDKPYQIMKECNGNREVIAMRNAPLKGTRRDRSTYHSYPNKLDSSLSRSRKKISELAKNNDWDFFVTFTINEVHYDRDVLETYIKDFRKWISNYSRKADVKKIHYLLVPDLHEDGAWHIHGLVKGIPKKHLTFIGVKKKSRCYKWKAYEKKFGFCQFETIRSIEGVASYLTELTRNPEMVQKYMQLNSSLYYCSQGLNRPKVIAEGYNLTNIDEYDYENEYVGVKRFDKDEYD